MYNRDVWVIRTDKVVSKTSFAIFNVVIELVSLLRKTFPHSPHVLHWFIKYRVCPSRTIRRRALALPPVYLSQACIAMLTSSWEKQ